MLLAALFIVSRGSFSSMKEKAYYIDFIGPSSVVTMQKTAAAPGAEAAAVKKDTDIKTPPKTELPKAETPDVDDFSSAPLPKPSVLSGGARLFEPETAAEPGEGGTPLTTDAANFPYPWYITQVRESLWNAWTERMPSGGSLRCTVRFVITRTGAVKSVSVERSSRNRLFDSAAESSVQAAAPFQPLPEDFFEDRLTVHVEFKAAD